MHMEELKSLDTGLSRNEAALQKIHNQTFCKWLEEKVQLSNIPISSRLYWLSLGPRKHIMSYSGYIINGQRFHTREHDRSTQNSGISFDAETVLQSSAKDTNPVVHEVSYYGYTDDIILLDYYQFKVPVFKCTWANIVSGIKYDDGFKLVNLHQGLSQFEKDPFILAT